MFRVLQLLCVRAEGCVYEAVVTVLGSFATGDKKSNGRRTQLVLGKFISAAFCAMTGALKVELTTPQYT